MPKSKRKLVGRLGFPIDGTNERIGRMTLPQELNFGLPPVNGSRHQSEKGLSYGLFSLSSRVPIEARDQADGIGSIQSNLSPDRLVGDGRGQDCHGCCRPGR